jgi:hypothetical protein
MLLSNISSPMLLSNTIGVSTHRVNLTHHMLPIGERTLKSLMEPPQCEESKRKKEKDGLMPTFTEKSRKPTWRD